MKKLLLTALAAISCAFLANAQSYTAHATVSPDEDWGTDYELLDLPNGVDVEAFNDHFTIKKWTGNTSQSLVIYFNDDEDITGISYINSGVESTPVTSGYASFYTKDPNLYYVSILVAPEYGYGYAYCDKSGGYAIFLAYFYDAKGNSVDRYYSIAWECNAEPLYTATGRPEAYPEWPGTALTPAVDVNVTVYDSYIDLANWLGTSGIGLRLGYDAFSAEVTSVATIRGEECGEDKTGDAVNVAIGDDNYESADIKLGEGVSFAYAAEDGGYVLLTLGLYNSKGDEVAGYYYLPFTPKAESVATIVADSDTIEFYNLQGMRLSAPVRGQVNIIRHGNKVTKAIVR